jgi:hypothetical protein
MYGTRPERFMSTNINRRKCTPYLQTAATVLQPLLMQIVTIYVRHQVDLQDEVMESVQISSKKQNGYGWYGKTNAQRIKKDFEQIFTVMLESRLIFDSNSITTPALALKNLTGILTIEGPCH